MTAFWIVFLFLGFTLGLVTDWWIDICVKKASRKRRRDQP